jgi:cytochrome c-type biogenesis protein CcmH/NrfF
VKRAAATLALLLVLAPAASACPKTSLGDIENEVICPVCGTSLALATEAPQAQRQRAFIERQIADCRSKDEIKAALTEEFGDEVLALPDDDGFEIAAYLVPAAILLTALAALGLGVRRWRRTRPAGPSAPAGRTDAERLDEDLARYEL